jgi:hypothetical protein
MKDNRTLTFHETVLLLFKRLRAMKAGKPSSGFHGAFAQAEFRHTHGAAHRPPGEQEQVTIYLGAVARGRTTKGEKMSNEETLAIAKVSNDLWNDNLWFRKLPEEAKRAVAHTVYLMRNDHLTGKVYFAKTMRAEISKLLGEEVANA